ncbi:MAG: hypothetical protein KJ042_00415, partial [Deltaproteobacteria bacterium]|nr:hypothetical protein [Deltaproteobacteria bacterium]
MRDRRTWTLLALAWTATFGVSLYVHTWGPDLWTTLPAPGWISHLLIWGAGILLLVYLHAIDGKLEQTRRIVASAREDAALSRQSEAEVAIAESEVRYRFLAENSTDLVWMTRLD